MFAKLSDVRWGSAVLGAAAALCISFFAVFGVIFVYGMGLGFAARGAPDTARIGRFAHQVAPLLGPVLLALVTLLAALRIGRRAKDPAVQGLAIGVIAAGAGFLMSRRVDVAHLAAFAVTCAAGWLGGRLVQGRAAA